MMNINIGFTTKLILLARYIFMFIYMKIHYFIKYIDMSRESTYNNIYDSFFGDLTFKLSTPNLFFKTITNIPSNSRILDLGCGNGICYNNSKIHELIIKNNLQITGIDIDPTYIKYCKERIYNNNLTNNVEILLQNIFDHKVCKKYDYVIFSESAPLMSEIFLNEITNFVITNLLVDNGKIIFINNLNEDPNYIVKFLKPLLKYIIHVDFGRILQKKDFENLAKSLNLTVNFKLISSLDAENTSKYLGMYFLYRFFNIFGLLCNYDIEQYEITINYSN